MKVSVIGLGKLGASMVAGFASRGFEVVGVDINPRSVEALKKGQPPVEETDLGDYIKKYSENITATLSYDEAINTTDISFVIIPTPSLEDGSFSLEFAKSSFNEIGKVIKTKSKYHVVVLTSTVLPGCTRSVLIPILERASGKVAGRDFGVCYNPEFIALGTVIRDFLNPDFYLLGQFDDRSGDILEMVHKKISANDAPVKRMTIENAELAKIAINSYVTLKISYANMLAMLCEKIPNGNVDIVSDALGLDSRIGRKYLTGGAGFAGPCFPRDNVALSFFGNAVGVDTSILKSNHEFNQNLAQYHFSAISQFMKPNHRVAVLGLSYKESSFITEEAEGIKLAMTIKADGVKIICHDSLVKPNEQEFIGLNITNDMAEVYNFKPDVYIICTLDASYIHLPVESLTDSRTRDIVVIDMWRKNSHLRLEDRVSYVPIGVNIDAVSTDNALHNIWKGKK